MIFPKVACLAYASCVELSVCVLTKCSHLVTSFTMVAIFAHARCVIDAVNVRTLRNLISVFDFFISHFFGFFQSSFSLPLLFGCCFTHPFFGLFRWNDNLSQIKGLLLVIVLSFRLRCCDRVNGFLELNCYRCGFSGLFFRRILDRLFLFKRRHRRWRMNLEFFFWLLWNANVWFTNM